jgi:hypothetical protein
MWGGEDWDAAVIKVLPDGSVDQTFGQTGAGAGSGFAFTHFDLGNRVDSNRALVVRTTGIGIPASPYRDEIFNVMYVAQACSAGTGIAKLNHDGAYVTSFGSSGRLRFGGWNDASNAQACGTIGATVTNAASISNGKLFLVGQDDAPTAFDVARAPMIASVDINSGAILQRSTSPVPFTYPEISYNGALYGVVPLDTDRFGVVGETTGLSETNRTMFITGIFGRDIIFANGFD